MVNLCLTKVGMCLWRGQHGPRDPRSYHVLVGTHPVEGEQTSSGRVVPMKGGRGRNIASTKVGLTRTGVVGARVAVGPSNPGTASARRASLPSPLSKKKATVISAKSASADERGGFEPGAVLDSEDVDDDLVRLDAVDNEKIKPLAIVPFHGGPRETGGEGG